MNKRRTAILLLGIAAVLLPIAGHYRYWRYNLKRFDVVRPGVLYRSGQPSRRGLDYLVHTRGVKTVICIWPEDPKLKEGMLFDWGGPRRLTESAELERLGVRFVHWPVGDGHVFWPWPQPSQFDEFFRLFDEPANLPAAVHCLQGRHRTGTCVALFRLEYDRWDVERALAEMHSFDFGPAVRIQEHNLRTYYPRPRPDPSQWTSLRSAFSGFLRGQPPADYEELVRRLRKLGDSPERRAAVSGYLEKQGSFGLCLAGRMVDEAEDGLVAVVARHARRCLDSSRGAFDDWAVSAALLADYGSGDDQFHLLRLLDRERQTNEPTPLYQALVAGVTNRYTAKRIAYLSPLLSDGRWRPEPRASKYRYCDTAAARLASITNERLFRNGSSTDRVVWDDAVENARRWFEDHPQLAPR